MRIPRVFFESDLAAGSQVNLSKEQAHYLGRVLRLKAGRELILFNGQGGEYLCQVIALDGKTGLIDVERYQDVDRESPLNICLAAVLSKGDRFDWLLQKATELGVSSIQPIFSERSEVRLSGDRLDKKHLHWQGVVRSACEQSGRTSLPSVGVPLSFAEYVRSDSSAQKIVLDPRESASLAEVVEGGDGPLGTLSLMVGPEGGFTDSEIETAKKGGYLGVRIGPRILRTETAPLAVLAAIQSRYGDW